MSIIDFNPNPSPGHLRQFGLITIVALPAISWILCGRPTTDWSAFQWNLMTSIVGVSIMVGLLGWFKPTAIKPVFMAMMIVTYPIGVVVGEAILLVIFLLVFTPFAFVFRLIGRDALQRKIDRDAETYWQPKEQPRDRGSYLRQS